MKPSIPPSTAWARRNPELHKKRNQEYRRKHKDKVNAKQQRYRRKNQTLLTYARKLGVSVPEARRILTKLDGARNKHRWQPPVSILGVPFAVHKK